MRLLIDGDIVVYRAGFAVERTVYTTTFPCGTSYEHPVGTLKKDIVVPKGDTLNGIKVPEPVENALNAAKMTVENILQSCKYSSYQLYISSDDHSNFRYEVSKERPYKGNRKQPKPTHYAAIRKYLCKRYGAQIVSGEEADDKLGIEMMKDPDNSVIVTIDKDLDMIPGWHFNFVLDKKYKVSEEEAMHNFYTQLLTGDTTDNIVGIPGIGPKKAAKILKGSKDPLQSIRAAYREYYKDKGDEVMLEMGRLLWIRRKEDEVWHMPDSSTVTDLVLKKELPSNSGSKD